MVRWIRRNNLVTFSQRDITRDLRRFRDDTAALEDALGWMVDHNLIRPRPEVDTTARPGRKPTPSYDVNPRLQRAPQY